jgi:serine/threonine-protein kinase
VLATGPEARSSASTPSQIFGRYRIIRTLAFGGMAQILLAVDGTSGQLVVIKRILPHYASNHEFVQFFIHEGHLGQRLKHPNLVQTLEAGQISEDCFIALEYLHGQPAIEMLRAAARAHVELPLGVAVRIVADAARGLHHAHTACDDDGQPLNVVHRDVTPHNLFVCVDGATKVLDFGIAKAASQLHHTRTGTIKGKFAYLAPEQIKGVAIDRRVDVFALGIVLHELLTLRPLFRGANDAETLQKVLSMDVPAPEKVRPHVPPGLGAVALRALQRDPERRLPSAQAMADSIEAVAAAEGIEASPLLVARFLAQLCPPDEVQMPATAPASEVVSGSSVTMSAPVPEKASRSSPSRLTPPSAVTGSSASAVRNPPSQPSLTTPPAGEVAAIESSLTTVRDKARRRTARIATAVGLVAVVVGLATTSGTCLRMAPREAMPKLAVPAPRELDPPSLPAVAPVAPAPSPVKVVPRGLPVAAMAAPEATLRVQTDGVASFVVDGRALKPASDGTLHLAPGRHSVTVSATGLAFARTLAVELAPGEAALRAVHGGRGQLRLAVSPWAEVTVDGRPLGITPFPPAELGEGAHTVTLRNKDLGVTTKRRVVISPNRESVLKVDLFTSK